MNSYRIYIQPVKTCFFHHIIKRILFRILSIINYINRNEMRIDDCLTKLKTMTNNHKEACKIYNTRERNNRVYNKRSSEGGMCNDIIGSLKRYRQEIASRFNIKTRGESVSKRGNCSYSITKHQQDASNLYASNYSFINSKTPTRGRTASNKRNTSPFSEETDTTSVKNKGIKEKHYKQIQDFRNSKIANGSIIKKGRIKNRYYEATNGSSSKEKKYNGKQVYNKDLNGKIKTMNVVVSINDPGQAKDSTENSNKSISAHLKAKSVFTGVQCYSKSHTIPVLAQIDTLLNNHGELSVEDIHFCFVTFYQRKNQLLKNIENRKERGKKFLSIKEESSDLIYY